MQRITRLISTLTRRLDIEGSKYVEGFENLYLQVSHIFLCTWTLLEYSYDFDINACIGVGKPDKVMMTNQIEILTSYRPPQFNMLQDLTHAPQLNTIYYGVCQIVVVCN